MKSCLALHWSSLLMLRRLGLWGCTLDFMVCEVAHWVQWCHSLHTGPSAAFCTHVKVISHSLLYLTTRIIWALPFRRRHCHISIAETQTCLKALSLLSSYYTVHAFPVISDYAKKSFRISHPEILPTPECRRRSNIFVTKKLQRLLKKKWKQKCFSFSA